MHITVLVSRSGFPVIYLLLQYWSNSDESNSKLSAVSSLHLSLYETIQLAALSLYNEFCLYANLVFCLFFSTMLEQLLTTKVNNNNSVK